MINFGFNRHTDKDNKDQIFELQELFEADHQWSQPINPLTPKISLVILPTVCHTVLVMLVWRIYYWIN